MADLRILVIANKRARQGEGGVEEVCRCLQAAGCHVLEEPSGEPGAIDRAIRQYAAQVDAVLLAGGDGTVNAALGALLDTGRRLAVFPTGTANDLARTLGLPDDPAGACEMVLEGNTERIDVGRVNDAWFVNVATIGMSVGLARSLSPEVKRRWGVLGYPLKLFRLLRRSRTFDATIRWEGGAEQQRAMEIVVGNGRFHGGGLMVAEDATLADGRLFLDSIRPQRLWQLAALVPAMRRGTHYRSDRIRHLRARSFEVVTSRPMEVETDGEITTRTPAVFSVLEAALPVYAPARDKP